MPAAYQHSNRIPVSWREKKAGRSVAYGLESEPASKPIVSLDLCLGGNSAGTQHRGGDGLLMDFAAARVELVQHLRHEIKDDRVLGAILRIPREMFVSQAKQAVAYEDRPLPIGQGQTISQPLIVAMMIEALELTGDERVLEVGTGSGYEAAILAELARWVVTVERHQELVDKARDVLDKLGYANIEIHLAEKRLGWPEGAPYSAIAVAAGAPRVPQQLLEQLAPGGRLVIPVGSQYEQDLLKVTKREGQTSIQNLGPCRWVPLVGEEAWSDE